MEPPLLLLFIFFFCGYVEFSSAGKALRVYDANNLDYRKQKYLVRLRIKSPFGSGLCSGSILSDRWILTSAHCFKKPDNRLNRYHVRVQRIEENTWVYIGVVKNYIITHPDFKPHREEDSEYDLAVIKTKKSMPLGTNLKPIKLNKCEIVNTIPAIIAGYGLSDFDHEGPTQGELEVQPCHPRLGSNLLCSYNYVRAGPGDSGGALISLDGQVLIGVTSASCRNVRIRKLCETVFVDIAYYLDWIKENTGIE